MLAARAAALYAADTTLRCDDLARTLGLWGCIRRPDVTAKDCDTDRLLGIAYSMTGEGVDPNNPASSSFHIDRDTGEIFVLKCASALRMLEKPDGQWRVCGDYRRLNDLTLPDRYPVPQINDVNSILVGNKIFSKVDLLKAYGQIPLAESDKEKSASQHTFWTL
ncbi:uncharacterized protein LOC126484899 [Schistocerca serialis cubense]|uniref:uncharacterized protein LOC126484899 n=1 Tax=Schistocerca serialis cubense TaxID=2023355 RepID=UPI00214F11A0|nr:uncharacterized protein LOC126484899 [Schistocerca serialis cubense]